VLVVGGIYSPNHQSGRWGRLLSKGAPDSPVRQPRHSTVRVRPLELLACGPPDSPVVHQTGPVHCPVRHLAPALTLRAQSALFTVHCSLFTFAVDRWCCSRYSAWHTGQSGATPDSPVNYSREHFQKPEGGKFRVILPGAPDTVWWHTGRSGAPDQGNLQLSFAPFYLNPFLDFLLVCIEPLAPVELII
jgi:hypothetical protein